MTDQKKPMRRLTDEIQYLTLFISSLIIIVVLVSLIGLITLNMLKSHQEQSLVTADETAAILREPLYNLDEVQAVRIGEALLSSGRISGITISSTATGLILSTKIAESSPLIPSIQKQIYYNDLELGIITLEFSDKDIRTTVMPLLLFAVIVILAVIIANTLAHRWLLTRRIAAPLKAILNGLNDIAAGNYECVIPETPYKDVNLLVSVINDMGAKIRAKNQELVEVNNSLELRVQERTVELQNSIQELHLAQDKLIESGKLSALGHLSAGIAHELNTPLGAILSSNNLIMNYFDRLELKLAEFLIELEPHERELYQQMLEQGFKASHNLEIVRQDRQKLRQMEADLEWNEIPNQKRVAELLSDIGINQLVPDTLFLLKTERNADILERASEAVQSRKMSEIINVAGQKASTVVSALRSYLSSEQNDENTEIDLNDNIDRILTLMNNMLKYGIKIKRKYGLARTMGSADKLGQVWMNIIRNAAEAMNFRGELTITTGKKGDAVFVTFEDDGPGIPEEHIDKIFTPFFSTKKQGEGMGLGLDICKRIIENHGGTIEVQSRPGSTIFTITLHTLQEETANG